MFEHREMGDRVLKLVEAWVPEKAYRSERKYQQDLHGYLTEQTRSIPTGLLDSGGGAPAVRQEYGKCNADVAVDDTVAIELKYSVTNAKTRRLESQIQDYREEFPVTIVCACGLEDEGRWNTLKQRYAGHGGSALDPTAGGRVEFVVKGRDGFSSTQSATSDGGPFGWDPGFDDDLLS